MSFPPAIQRTPEEIRLRLEQNAQRVSPREPEAAERNRWINQEIVECTRIILIGGGLTATVVGMLGATYSWVLLPIDKGYLGSSYMAMVAGITSIVGGILLTI